jgi:hypothetical protein
MLDWSWSPRRTSQLIHTTRRTCTDRALLEMAS